jgi:hypothetical protein
LHVRGSTWLAWLGPGSPHEVAAFESADCEKLT